MRERHEEVLLAVPELDRHADVVEREAPRLGEREIVVAPAVDAFAAGVLHALREIAPEVAREHCRVDVGEERLKPLEKSLSGHLMGRPGTEVLLERLAPVHCRPELVEIRLAHPAEPVEVGRVHGRDRRQGSDGGDTVGQQRCAGERVRPAA